MSIDSLLRYYSHAYYRNGFFRDPSSVDKNVLTFETGFYALEFDVFDWSKIWYTELQDEVIYKDCCSMNRVYSLEEGVLKMEIKQGDTSYTCTTMQPPKDVGKPFDGTVIMWETGKVSQRFEVLNLQFQDMNKKALEGKFSLTIQVWPDAFALTLKAIDTTGDMQVTLQANKWTVERCFQGKFDLTLQCNIKERSTNATLNVTTDAINKDVVPQTSNPAMQTRYDASMHAYETAVEYWYVAKPGFLGRKFKMGYTDIREYDDYEIALQEGTTSPTPYVLSMGMPANVTGMCPMLLTRDGLPSGIPVQVSKNWHWAEERFIRQALHGFAFLGQVHTFELPMAFTGHFPPPVTHSYLFGAMARIFQVVAGIESPIGCWGETFCIDTEFSCGVDGRITDVRGLMMGSKPEQKWNWTHCASGWRLAPCICCWR
jgi:hypothetical protein